MPKRRYIAATLLIAALVTANSIYIYAAVPERCGWATAGLLAAALLAREALKDLRTRRMNR
ncbi:hypothetical protein [Streptomyces sp. NPDC047070]|uniref:hypothetical protein n=1 Tax=Streptomyces sp. NPDC047070 TaxID=3154923 RepID=UPI0034535563